MTTRLTALLVTTALLGCLVGARAAGGPTLLATSAPSTADDAGVRERHALFGGFWRPAGSDAARPVASVERVTWTPADRSARPLPDALAAFGAVERLAELD